MPKHILAIVSSPRKNGNSELLVDQFIAPGPMPPGSWKRC